MARGRIRLSGSGADSPFAPFIRTFSSLASARNATALGRVLLRSWRVEGLPLRVRPVSASLEYCRNTADPLSTGLHHPHRPVAATSLAARLPSNASTTIRTTSYPLQRQSTPFLLLLPLNSALLRVLDRRRQRKGSCMDVEAFQRGAKWLCVRAFRRCGLRICASPLALQDGEPERTSALVSTDTSPCSSNGVTSWSVNSRAHLISPLTSKLNRPTYSAQHSASSSLGD